MLRQFCDAALSASLVQQKARRLEAKGDVLSHRMWLDQHKVLVDHADTQVNSVARRAQVDLLTLDINLPFVGPVQA